MNTEHQLRRELINKDQFTELINYSFTLPPSVVALEYVENSSIEE